MARLTVAGLGSLLVATAVAGTFAVPQKPVPPPATPASQRPTEVELVIKADGGTPPRLAVPDFVALTPDAAEAARTIGQVLWDDLNFEREFYLIARDTYATVPEAHAIEQVPFASWRELGADGLIFGTVERTGDTLRVQVRLLDVATGRSALAKEYSGSASNPRLYAHTASDDVHLQQRALRGVARSKLAFVSDRFHEQAEGFDVKEVFVSDYDGGNQQRITSSRHLNLSPSWSPDGRAVAYTSFRLVIPDIFISRIYEGILENPLKGVGGNYLPVWSPDGTRIAFFSNRDGNPEIYVMNRDGSDTPPAHESPSRRLDADVVAQRCADRVHVRPRGAASALCDE